MNNDIEKGLSLTYEIEGLLHLVEHRQFAEIPASVSQLLQQKSAALATLLAQPQTFEDVTPANSQDRTSAEAEDQEKLAETVEYEQAEDSQPDASTPDAYLTKLDEAQAEEDEADNEAALMQKEREKYYGEIAKKRSAGSAILQGFTLQDRYLFTKELFGGSSTAFNVIIDEISTLGSINEVERYLEQKQGLNLHSATGKEFMAKLAHAFK